MAKEIKGKRVHPVDGKLSLGELEYGKNPVDGNWYCRPPGCHMGSLEGHQVTEHEDSTITASPSILLHDGEKELWHGYLQKGIWKGIWEG